ncbi:MAG: MerR family transcriptional regulator [Myxococcales bacterium]|nr:MerR family transcriptional regulator [Myxococcales bacterium]
MPHERARQLLKLTRKRVRDPLPGSLVAQLLAFIDKHRGLPQGDTRLDSCIVIGMLYLQKEGQNRSVLEVAAGMTLEDMPLPGPDDGEKVAEFATKKAQNTHTHEHRDRGRRLAKTQVARLHGCRCIAQLVAKFGAIPPDFGLDGRDGDLLVTTAALVLLQDGADKEVQRLVERRATQLVGNPRKLTAQQRDLAHDLWTEYATKPPDYLKAPPSEDIGRVWGSFVMELKGKLSTLREAKERRRDGEMPARTIRYKKQKGIRTEDMLAAGYKSRSEVARKHGVSPTTLVRLEKKGLLKPKRLRDGVGYDDACQEKARKLIEEQKARRSRRKA